MDVQMRIFRSYVGELASPKNRISPDCHKLLDFSVPSWSVVGRVDPAKDGLHSPHCKRFGRNVFLLAQSDRYLLAANNPILTPITSSLYFPNQVFPIKKTQPF